MNAVKALLQPRSVAVIGASRKRGKIGHEVLRNLIDFGYSGKIYPVNPNADTVRGLRCYPSVLSIGGDVDLAVVCVPAEMVPEAVTGCGRKGVRVVAVVSSGFKEIGRSDLEERVVETASRHGMRVLGPNIFGVIYTPSKLNASFGPRIVRPGRIAFITQSGAIGIALMYFTILEHIGLSAVVSMGNKSDIDDSDLLEFFSEDPHTSVVLIYMEGLVRGRRFLGAAMRTSVKKPVIVIKAGRTSKGAQAASTHTGALASSFQVMLGAFNQSGVLYASSIEQAFDWARIFVEDFRPLGGNLLILTNGGGLGVLAADACDDQGVELMKPTQKLREELKKHMPYFGSVENPIDLTAVADDDAYYESVLTAMGDPDVHTVLAMYTQGPLTDPTLIAAKIIKAMKDVRLATRKPIVFCGVGGEQVERAIRLLQEAGIPAYRTPERSVSAVSVLLRYTRARARMEKKLAMLSSR